MTLKGFDMKKIYSTALLKTARKRLPQALDGFELEKDFGTKHYGKASVSLRQKGGACTRCIVLFPDDSAPTSFHVDLCWARSLAARMLVNEQATERGNGGILVPRTGVEFGSVGLQYLCGYQIALGYRIPSPYDSLDVRKTEARRCPANC